MNQYSFLCMAMEFKGASFMTTLKSMGHRVFLLTEEEARHEPWPRESIDEIFYAPRDRDAPHNRQQLIDGTAWLMREHGIDRIVALDDFDVEDAALLREEFRLPGMGQTTARYFRDKLAMRLLAEEHDIAVPPFSPLFRRSNLQAFCDSTEGPWVIKPRSEASAKGISKVYSAQEALEVFDALGDHAYRYLIECFAPGEVFHVDALVDHGSIAYVRSSQYVDPPLAVVQGGGLFQTRMLSTRSKEARELKGLTERVMTAFGMRYSASHTEFIRDRRGKFLLLETSSRVGGAYISTMIEQATGVDLWSEWAKLEVARLAGTSYKVGPVRNDLGAITIKAVGTEHPEVLEADAKHVAYRISKPYHVGRVFVASALSELEQAQAAFAKTLLESGL